MRSIGVWNEVLVAGRSEASSCLSFTASISAALQWFVVVHTALLLQLHLPSSQPSEPSHLGKIILDENLTREQVHDATSLMPDGTRIM
jgi:hypothetical protein